MYEFRDILELFLKARDTFLDSNRDLIKLNLNERNYCHHLACEITSLLRQSNFKKYFCDVEYNRDHGQIKTIKTNDGNIRNINVDLIIHSRCNDEENDNMLALEMKKISNTDQDIENDRERLRYLTNMNREYRYKYGILFLIDCNNVKANIEIYQNGRKNNMII
ncbi:MAG: hypothetical protein E7184_00325 [Erysipelotrichaceae bacterium]|nr:hypothetical protein [Erysipelotrichaceae bacterium]